MEFDNTVRLRRCLDILEAGLLPFVKMQLENKYRDEWWQKGIEPPLDKHGDKQWRRKLTPENCWDGLELSDSCWIITDEDNWYKIFSQKIGKDNKGRVHNLRKIRNIWAHSKISSGEFSNERMTEYLNSMIDFLMKIGKIVEAKEIKALKDKNFQNIPYPRNHSFFGREDVLLDIYNQLFQNNAEENACIFLTGMGGIGKTELALEYVYRHPGDYSDGRFWVNSSIDFESELIKVAKDFVSNILFGREFKENEAIVEFSKYLVHNHNTLIIIDNLPEISMLDKPIFGVIPSNLSGHIIITTRKKLKKSSQNSIEVKGIDPDAAVRLLFSGKSYQEVLDRQDPDLATLRDAHTICETFGFHPLAISRASAFIERFPDISLKDFLSRLKIGRTYKTIVKIDSDKLNQLDHYETSINKLFHSMWDSLENPQSKIVLQILSLFDDLSRVPRSLISLLAGIEDDRKINIGEPTPLGLALEKLKILRFIDEQVLQKSYFSIDYKDENANANEFPLSVTTQETERRYEIHPLIRDFASQTIPDEQVLINNCVEIFIEGIRDPEILNNTLVSRGIDMLLEEFQPVKSLIYRSTNKWIDIKSSLYFYFNLLKKESHNIRNWNRVDFQVMINYPPDWFNPRELPGFALQQVYNRLFVENNSDANNYLYYLKTERLPVLCELAKVRSDSSFLEMTLLGHSDHIVDMVVTQDTQYLISSSEDGTIKVWDIATGKAINDTLRYENWPLFTAVNCENQRVVSNYENWEKWVDKEELFERLNSNTPDAQINDSSINSIDHLAASINDSGSILVWDTEDGTIITQLETEPDFYFYPTPSSLFFSMENERLILQNSKGVIVWKITNWNRVLLIKNDEDFDYSTSAFDPERNLLICGDSAGNFTMIDIDTGLVSKIKNVHNGLISKILIDPIEERIITASDDGLIKVWKWDDGTLISIRCFDFTRSSINDIAITTKGDVLLSGQSDGTLIMWDLKTEKQIKTLFGHGKSITKVLISADNSHAFSISEDQSIKIWSLKQIIEESDEDLNSSDIFGIVLSKNSKYGIGIGATTAVLYDLDINSEISNILFENEDMKGIILTEDGTQVILYGNSIYLWDYLNDTEPHTIVFNDDLYRSFIYLTSNNEWALSRRTNCDQIEEGKEHPQDTIEVWNLDANEITFAINVEPHSARSFIIDEFGKRVSANRSSSNRNDGILDEIPEFEYWAIQENGFNSSSNDQELLKIKSLISADGRFLLIELGSGIIEIRNLLSDELISSFSVGSSDLSAKYLAISLDNHYASIIFSDGSIHLWDLKESQCKAVLPGSFISCAITTDGSKILCVDSMGQVHFLEYINNEK